MHILIICNEFPPGKRIGGIGYFTQKLSSALVEYGHECTVIGLYSDIDHNIDEINESGVRLIKISVKKTIPGFGTIIGKINLYTYIKKINNETPIDLVESPDYEGNYWLIPELPFPKVVRLHGSETYFRTILGEKLKWLYKLNESRSILKANSLVSVSSYTLRKTLEIFNIKKESMITDVIHNHINLDDINKIIDANNTKAIKNRIIYTGTFIRKKGVIDLFKSLEYVFDKIDDAHLVCIGNDSSDIKTNNISTKNVAFNKLPKKYHNRVKFLGKRSNEELLSHVLLSSVCVYPSYLEACPTVWLEAMSMSKPIVASNTGPGPEVIEHGISGLLCHPSDHRKMADYILFLLENKEEAEKMGNQARLRIEKLFSMSSLIKKNIGFYKRTIDFFRS